MPDDGPAATLSRPAHRVHVGVQLQAHHTDPDAVRAAWRAAESLGVDSIWLWDHLVPFVGDADGSALEAVSLSGALAVDTVAPTIGIMVAPLTFRDPAVLAAAAHTLDHLSGGRFVLGIGAGGYVHDDRLAGTQMPLHTRMARFAERAATLRARLDELGAGRRRVSVMVGGEGEAVTLRVAAMVADAWTGFGPPERFAQRNAALDDWCRRLGRPPDEIERVVLVREADEPVELHAYVAAGATHVVRSLRPPFDLSPVQHLLDQRH